MRKEQNFISAVIFLSDEESKNLNFLQMLYGCLDEHFLQFELIAVAEKSSDASIKAIRDWSKTINKPLTLIKMSLLQPHEQCMNAGLDCSIGDYIYEFDSVEMPYAPELIWQTYELAQQGNDIVTVCPKNERWTSRQFYRVFNANSHSAYRLRTDAFRLVSRRALNRVHSINGNLPYRKATYSACGLKMVELEFDKEYRSGNTQGRFGLAADALVLYTDFGYKFSIGLATAMILLTLAELIYTLVTWINGSPIAGWTTTMFVLTVGLTGLFAILAILLKYLTLLLRITFHKQSYLIESTEKM